MAKLISAARERRSGAVVLRAAAGLGKTYLLERAVDEYATDVQVLAINGIEAESAFDCAVLQRLCGQLLDHAHRLPGLQHHALLDEVRLRITTLEPPPDGGR